MAPTRTGSGPPPLLCAPRGAPGQCLLERSARRAARASRRSLFAARRCRASRADGTRLSTSPPIRYICVLIAAHPSGPVRAAVDVCRC